MDFAKGVYREKFLGSGNPGKVGVESWLDFWRLSTYNRTVCQREFVYPLVNYPIIIDLFLPGMVIEK